MSVFKHIPLFIFIALTVVAKAQSPGSLPLKYDDSSKIYIRNIIVSGNKKTKDYVIHREMQIKKGDSILSGALDGELKKAKKFIYNTTLFAEVNLWPAKLDNNTVDIFIVVKERWYIYPIPYFELADRSFNEWYKTYNASLDRVSYGIVFSHLNFSGRRDALSLILINGFKRNISFEYDAPYINSTLQDGMKLGGGFAQTREIPYATDFQNKLQFYKNDHFVKSEWFINVAYNSRKKLKKKETFALKFRHIEVDDSIVTKYNPAYFNNSSATQNIIDLEYKLEFTDVDNVSYPLKGHLYSLVVIKRGLGIRGGLNVLSLEPSFEKYFSYGNDWYASLKFSGGIKLPFKQPYYNLKAIGYYDNYLRGLEYYVVDGVLFGIGKLDVKKKLVNFSIPTFINSKHFNRIPFTIYAKGFTDVGYSYSKLPTQLNNKFLYTNGFGIDIVTLYDFKISLEYSFNQLGQKGLFLHN